MSGYPHNVPGYGYGQPPPPQPYSTPYGAAPPPSSSPYGAPPPPSSSAYGAPPPQSHSSAPYGAPAPPQSHSPYAPVPSPYSTGAPSYGSDPHKPPKENKPQSYGGYPAPPPSAPYGDPNKPPKDNNPHASPYGGYHAPAPYGATSPFASLVPSAFPPGTDPNVIACFQLADQDGSGLIDDKELQKALSSYNQSFSLRTVHLLMYLFTNTNTRKIGPKEFTSVFYSLQEWRGIFERFDRDRSGRIDSSELRDALLSLGYAVSPPILDLLVSKFDKTGGKNKAIEYDNFIECCLTVKGLTDKFKEKDTSYSAISQFSRAYSQRNIKMGRRLCSFSYRDYSAVAPSVDHSTEKDYHSKPQVNLNKMFWSRPQSLALAPDSPLRIDEPQYEGIQRFLLKLMLFYSKQSTSIRGAHVIYRRVIHQIDRPAIYDVFSLEKTFKTTFALLVIHMWLCLRRLKQEGKEGVELGQYLYEIYNHDLELRVSKAGVNLLLTKWMKDLEKIFYGNIVAYDAAMLPEAGQDELQTVIWRNVFSDDGTSLPNDAALLPVQAICRYVRRESNCLSLTDKDAVFSGNFTFTSLENTKADKEGN